MPVQDGCDLITAFYVDATILYADAASRICKRHRTQYHCLYANFSDSSDNEECHNEERLFKVNSHIESGLIFFS